MTKAPTVFSERYPLNSFPPVFHDLIPKYPHVYFMPSFDRLGNFVQMTWIEDNCTVGTDINCAQDAEKVLADVKEYLGDV
jgi:hypothetical protein